MAVFYTFSTFFKLRLDSTRSTCSFLIHWDGFPFAFFESPPRAPATMPKSWKEQKYKGKLTLTRTARDVQSDLQSFQFPSHWRDILFTTTFDCLKIPAQLDNIIKEAGIALVKFGSSRRMRSAEEMKGGKRSNCCESDSGEKRNNLSPPKKNTVVTCLASVIDDIAEG